jgi:hypothetical protein
MKKRNLLVMAVLVVALSVVIVAPSSACTGCTPGYWKNHLDAWQGYDPYADTFYGVFGVGPHMTLLDALSAQNKDVGSGVEAAYIRHATAALLNATAFPGEFWSEAAVKYLVGEMYGTEGPADVMGTKAWFAWENESSMCPGPN